MCVDRKRTPLRAHNKTYNLIILGAKSYSSHV